MRKRAEKVITIEDKKRADAKFDTDHRWREYGDLHGDAMKVAFEGFYFGYTTKEGVRRAAEALKEELGIADASPVERIMIEHAVLCHVRLGAVEHLYSRSMMGKSYRMDVAEHW